MFVYDKTQKARPIHNNFYIGDARLIIWVCKKEKLFLSANGSSIKAKPFFVNSGGIYLYQTNIQPLFF